MKQYETDEGRVNPCVSLVDGLNPCVSLVDGLVWPKRHDMSASLGSTTFLYNRAQGPAFNDAVSNQKLLQKLQTKEEKANFLAQETGMELVMAEEFLSSNNWNLSEAMKGYKELVEMEKKRKPARPTTAANNLKQIGRGFSMSNVQLVQQARDNLVIEERHVDDNTLEKLAVTSRRSFVLPDITQFGKVLAAFIREDLISATAMTALTTKGRLNWWADIGACRKLFPLSTIGDGNCLLHAASLGMWGFHDRMLKLRKALHLVLQSPNAKKSMKRRWKYNLWKENMKSGNLMYSRLEWEEEWDEVVKLASERPHRFDASRKPRRMSRAFSMGGSTSDGDMLMEGESLDSLEAIHVYVLANLIRRPIIVISEDMLKDSSGRDIAPIPFGGIYLPLEKSPEQCWKYPLVLAYDASHFSALVPAEGESLHKGERLSTSIPLMDSTLSMLPIRFSIDPGSSWDLVQDDSVKEERTEFTYEENLKMLRDYLDVVKVTFNNGRVSPEMKLKTDKKNGINRIMNHVHDMFVGQPLNVLIAARLNIKERPDHYAEMIENYLSNARQRLQKLKISKTKCKNSTCTMFSSPEFKGYCVVCHEKRIYSPRTKKKIMTPKLHSRTQHDNSNSAATTNNLTTIEASPSRTITTTAAANAEKTKTNHHVQFQTNEKLETMSQSGSSGGSSDSLHPLYENTIDLTDGGLGSPTANVDNFGLSISGIIHCYQNVGVRCQSPGCKFYGSLETKGYCSSCYRKKTASSI